MKKYLLAVFGIVVVSVCSFSADVVPRGAMDLNNASVRQVLQLYKYITGAELVTDSRVGNVLNGVTLRVNSTDKEEAPKVLQKALLEQAGVVLTPLEDKRVSVTYNDALPIKQAKEN